MKKFLNARQSGIECLGIHPDVKTALRLLPKELPNVALVDLNLPGASGIELIARLKELCPSILCLVLTTYEESTLIFDALKAGACGYLLKRTPPAEIISAIVQVKDGGSPMSPQIARQVVSFFHRTPATDDFSTLTDRERTVLDHLSQGAMYKEIAALMDISLDTVRSHLRKVYEKLHVHSRTEALLKYLGK